MIGTVLIAFSGSFANSTSMGPTSRFSPRA
jgi:hypothetical protein